MTADHVLPLFTSCSSSTTLLPSCPTLRNVSPVVPLPCPLLPPPTPCNLRACRSACAASCLFVSVAMPVRPACHPACAASAAPTSRAGSRPPPPHVRVRCARQRAHRLHVSASRVGSCSPILPMRMPHASRHPAGAHMHACGHAKASASAPRSPPSHAFTLPPRLPRLSPRRRVTQRAAQGPPPP